MYIIEVKFYNDYKNGLVYQKVYSFNSDTPLIKGGDYEIEADRTYSNPVRIISVKKGFDSTCKKLTKANPIRLPKINKPYKKIYVNPKKETVCVIWNDGTNTVMRPQFDDEFDLEKGIALCFMKKFFDNRGCYNNAFRDYEISE